MISLQSLDIVIGMVVVYLAASLLCSSINELLAATLALRANTLHNALDSLLGSKLAAQVIAHPAIPATDDGARKAPSYIEPALFACALLDTVLPPHDAAPASTDAPLRGSPAEGALSAFLRMTNGDYAKLQKQVANWFDAYMDRVGGAYKRRAQLTIAIIAVCVVAILNLDSLKIFKQLTSQPAVAAALAAKAGPIVAAGPPQSQPSPSSVGADADAVYARIAALPVPIGWHRDDAVNPWWQKVIGLLITAIAASLGAPFWFDALSKLANLRSVGDKP